MCVQEAYGNLQPLSWEVFVHRRKVCMFYVGVYIGERVWSLCVCIFGCAGDSCNVRELQVWLDSFGKMLFVRSM